ncbi:type II toxin-antitoxin system HicA family toxin [Candidatus Parcubacteria bacterium]|nr:type II toxin-antitoxin system HicA family toxin [Candidatus Parcubacteria bacterium]
MAKYFKARRAGELNAFLEANGFYLAGRDGDDRIYAKKGYRGTIKTPDRKNDEIPDGTMCSIKKWIRSCGFSNQDILHWWKQNGYGE